MALILNIDTATETASICLANDEAILQIAVNENQKDHASWLQPAIQSLLNKQNIEPSRLNAIAVSNGPGSYTGLRVGLSTAKGLCYSLNIPLITINTLEMMASAFTDTGTDLICPMIDARRMEVFTAVYNQDLAAVIQPQAMILNENSFATLLEKNKMVFSGSGVDKFQKLVLSKNAFFSTASFNSSLLVKFSRKRFHEKQFADLAYAEPFYLKDFHSSKP
jgi:tRNA threonylcarbamoyladenosine biosynthesis protein TsaB